jgi:hypothetical protein
MNKAFPIVLSLFVVACMSNNKKQQFRAVDDEAALKNFVFATVDPNKEKSLRVLDAVLADAAKDSVVFAKTVAFLEKPFGDPNSPHRNEELYIKVLQARMKSAWCDSITRAKTRNELYLRMQNQPGGAANDFVYRTPAGFKKKMYDLKADFTLLFFYNPECAACKEMKDALVKSEIINRKAKVLDVYTDRDEKVWLNHLPELPTEWIHGRDEDEYLYKNKVYDLRAIPAVYLLDKDKKVVLKDCVDVMEIEKMLE